MIGVDVGLARDIHRVRLRALRGPLLAALDVRALRAMEAGDAAGLAEIVARKAVLRDAPAAPAINQVAPAGLLATIADPGLQALYLARHG